MEKSSTIKVLIILFGYTCEEELTYRYIFAFKFTFRSQQPDIVPILCHRCRWYQRKIAAGIVDTGRKFAIGINNTSKTGGKICHQCRWYLWQAARVFDTGGAPWLAKSLRIFKKIQNGPNGILWGWGETDSWKKPEAKNLVTLSL